MVKQEIKATHKMNRKGAMLIAAIAAIFVATLVVYKVDVTEYAVVTQFGNPDG